MSHYPSTIISDGTDRTYAAVQGDTRSQTFESEQMVPVPGPNNGFNLDPGQPSLPTFSIAFQNVHPTQQMSNSGSGSHTGTSSAPSVATGADRIRRTDLPLSDKDNVDRACDLLILEIVESIGWNSSSEQLAISGQECLSQASAETQHYTAWDSNIFRMLVDHTQNLRSKMATKAEVFARRYELSNIVDPTNALLPADRRTAAMAHCEQMLMNANWDIYYLHHRSAATGACALFENQILRDFHVDFWYRSSLSPFRGNQDNMNAWDTTPIRLLSTSATALACGLRRVAQCVGMATRPARLMRYSLDEYNTVEAQITTGMRHVLAHENSFVRESFEAMLFRLHQQGCAVINGVAGATFFIPTVQQLQGMMAPTTAGGSAQ